ncbi:MAG: tyrosine-type recombinase/integrase [gamma proteobacterium symbiont of Taylorina sp.]|nr:tyrosine-type recombinase/integrase [gamma proteobacterium symbiont of Taylorina sp.]
MTPRPRKNKNKGLPENLYPNGNYFRYKRPDNGKMVGLGNLSKEEAIKTAKALNSRLIVHQTAVNRAVNKVMGIKPITFETLVADYNKDYVPQRNYAESTKKENEYRINHIKEKFGDTDIRMIDTRYCSDFLDTYSGDAYIKHRQMLIDLFKVAESKGYINHNPASKTLTKNIKIKIRQRLTLEQFNAIHKVANTWLQNAMDIALITLQRRGDITLMKFDDIKDEHLIVDQNKGKRHKNKASRLKIAIGQKLKRTLKKCRDDIVSPFIIHRNPARRIKWEGRQHWAQVRDETLSKEFSKARDKTGLFKDMAKAERPTFHEIRSLGGDIYEQKYGKDFVQKLYGHTSEGMTDVYLERPENWTEVKAD